MRLSHRRPSGPIVFAVTAALLLSGCSSANVAGLSAYGSNKLTVAEINDGGVTTADGALSEARAHFRNRDWGHSAAYYKRAAELAPGNAEAFAGLGASYDRLRRFDLADRAYDKLHQLDGGSVRYHNNVGYSLMLRGNLRDAYSNFRKAEALSPGNVVVANNLQILARAAAEARA